MKKLFLCLGLLFVSAANSQSSSVPVPEIRVGDSWTYTRTDNWTKKTVEIFQLRVTGVSTDGYRIEGKRLDKDAPPDTQIYDQDWNRVGSIFTPAKKSYFFPLEIGKNWETKYSWKTSDQRGVIAYEGSVKVLGWEHVTVPAGSFETIKLESRVWWRIGGDGRTGQDIETYWYSPKVKRSVKNTFRVLPSGGGPAFTDETRELKEYFVE